MARSIACDDRPRGGFCDISGKWGDYSRYSESSQKSTHQHVPAPCMACEDNPARSGLCDICGTYSQLPGITQMNSCMVCGDNPPPGAFCAECGKWGGNFGRSNDILVPTKSDYMVNDDVPSGYPNMIKDSSIVERPGFSCPHCNNNPGPGNQCYHCGKIGTWK